VKLLFDENLSPRLIELLAAEFPDRTHVERLGMRGASDAAIWAHALDHGFVNVSKDNDFRQYAFLCGPPPKMLCLAVGNAGTAAIARLLASRVGVMQRFDQAPEQSLLVVEERA